MKLAPVSDGRGFFLSAAERGPWHCRKQFLTTLYRCLGRYHNPKAFYRNTSALALDGDLIQGEN